MFECLVIVPRRGTSVGEYFSLLLFWLCLIYYVTNLGL